MLLEFMRYSKTLNSWFTIYFWNLIFSGGLALQGNPWRCSCENTWLGLWLRRWMRETLQLHTSGVERGQTIQSIVRTITCVQPDYAASTSSGQRLRSRNGLYDHQKPLVDLDNKVKCYQDNDGVSSASRNEISIYAILTLWCIFKVGL